MQPMTTQVIHIDDKSSEFSDAIKMAGGVDVNWCMQCGKCASGCPVSYEMDLTPSQLIHAIQLGLKDLVYNSKTMWLCAACQTCSTRCPQDVDIAEVLDTVKILMQRDKKKAQVPNVLKANKRFIGNLKWFGRLYELGMVGMLKLSTRNLTQDMGMGIKMLKKGKFSIFPRFRGARMVRKILRRVKKQEKV
jgi:heterodisulfide reductase subunit C